MSKPFNIAATIEAVLAQLAASHLPVYDAGAPQRLTSLPSTIPSFQ